LCQQLACCLNVTYNTRPLVAIDDDQVVIDFMSPTCGACQEIAPVFAECAKEYPTQGVFLKVDIFELKVSSYTYGVGVSHHPNSQ
jgi:thiol-disulfide isomerase/thioredoxin